MSEAEEEKTGIVRLIRSVSKSRTRAVGDYLFSWGEETHSQQLLIRACRLLIKRVGELMPSEQ